MPRLASLHLYPIKSCGGLAQAEWEVDAFGLRHDRRWMIMTPEGAPVTQRELPEMALIHPRIEPPHLVVSAPGMKDLVLALEPQGGRPVAGKLWGDPVRGIAPDHQADAWFSTYLGHEVILAYVPQADIRPVDPAWAPAGGQVGFADGFPFLLIGEASLADLNRRMPAPLPMNRFRPNLVVADSEPFAEDGWKRITVGPIAMQVVKPCARCVLTTTDQATGTRPSQEPLRTLATFRRQNNSVMFGQNVVHYGTGTLRVGDAVVV